MLSGLIFEQVQEKFVTDLKIVDGHLAQKNQYNRDHEAKGALLIRALRHLQVKSYPEETWDRTCDFMLSMAKLFTSAHGQPVKYAYCQVLRELLLRITSKATIELNAPKWKAVIDMMKQRAAILLGKPKHWHEAFPLMAAVLCASPTETFLSQWRRNLDSRNVPPDPSPFEVYAGWCGLTSTDGEPRHQMSPCVD